jgi:hypothetical protein
LINVREHPSPGHPGGAPLLQFGEHLTVPDSLVAGLRAGYGIAVPVGAVAVMIVGLAARTSLRVGAAAALGVATADGLYALATVAAGVALARLVEPVPGGRGVTGANGKQRPPDGR